MQLYRKNISFTEAGDAVSFSSMSGGGGGERIKLFLSLKKN
jgi:hypothetical protein